MVAEWREARKSLDFSRAFSANVAREFGGAGFFLDA